jgi:hypothetical protein
VKPPDGFARERIKRANVATRSCGKLSQRLICDDQILVDQRGDVTHQYRSGWRIALSINFAIPANVEIGLPCGPRAQLPLSIAKNIRLSAPFLQKGTPIGISMGPPLRVEQDRTSKYLAGLCSRAITFRKGRSDIHHSSTTSGVHSGVAAIFSSGKSLCGTSHF